jgi:hypothetical protein
MYTCIVVAVGACGADESAIETHQAVLGEDEPTEADLVAYIGTDKCDGSNCGLNGVIGVFDFHELNVDSGRANDAGVRLQGMQAPPSGGVRRPLTVAVHRHFLEGHDDPGVVSGAGLRGARLVLAKAGGGGYLLEVQDVGTTFFWVDPDAGDPIPTYNLGYRVLDAAEGTPFRPVCDPAIGGGFAIVFQGDRYDAATKTVSAAPAVGSYWFNLACLGAVLSKMHLTRHTEAGSDVSHTTTLAERQAFLKMITADYSGSGRSFTANGVPVQYLTARGWHITGHGPDVAQSLPNPTTESIDAVWNEDGAVCVSLPRRSCGPQSEVGCSELTRAIAAASAPRSLPRCEDLGTLDQVRQRGYVVSLNPVRLEALPASCQQASDTYGMDSFTFGFAPPNIQRWWTQTGCATHRRVPDTCQLASDRYGVVAGVTFGYAPEGVRAWWVGTGCDTRPLRTSDLCQRASDTFGIDVGVTWGSAPSEVRSWWRASDCRTSPAAPETCQLASDRYGIVAGVTFGYAPTKVRAWWVSTGCDTRPLRTLDLCQRASDTFGIIAGVTFGSAPVEVQDWWRSNVCQTSPAPRDACQRARDLYAIVPGISFGFAPAEVQSWWVANACGPTTRSFVPECQRTADRYGIHAGVTWGFAPPDVQSWWVANSCDAVASSDSTCQLASEAYGIDAGVTFGFAPPTVQSWWVASACNTSPSENTCQRASDIFGIDAGITFAFAPSDVRSWWVAAGCNTQPR